MYFLLSKFAIHTESYCKKKERDAEQTRILGLQLDMKERRVVQGKEEEKAEEERREKERLAKMEADAKKAAKGKKKGK